MKRWYQKLAMVGLLATATAAQTVTCNIPDINVAFVPRYDRDYDDDYVVVEEYYYDDCCYDDGFDFWGWGWW